MIYHKSIKLMVATFAMLACKTRADIRVNDLVAMRDNGRLQIGVVVENAVYTDPMSCVAWCYVQDGNTRYPMRCQQEIKREKLTLISSNLHEDLKWKTITKKSLDNILGDFREFMKHYYDKMRLLSYKDTLYMAEFFVVDLVDENAVKMDATLYPLNKETVFRHFHDITNLDRFNDQKDFATTFHATRQFMKSRNALTGKMGKYPFKTITEYKRFAKELVEGKPLSLILSKLIGPNESFDLHEDLDSIMELAQTALEMAEEEQQPVDAMGRLARSEEKEAENIPAVAQVDSAHASASVIGEGQGDTPAVATIPHIQANVAVPTETTIPIATAADSTALSAVSPGSTVVDRSTLDREVLDQLLNL